MAKVGKRLPGSTLVEVLVAMVIILVVALIITNFFTKNYRQLNTGYKLRSMLVLNNEVDRVFNAECLEVNVKESNIVDGFVLETFATENSFSNQLVNVSVSVRRSDGRLVAKRSVICFRKCNLNK